MKFVTITDISKVDLAGHDGLRLGQNKVRNLSQSQILIIIVSLCTLNVWAPIMFSFLM
jgi:hypothetical protein